MDIKEFADVFGAKMGDLYVLEEKQNKVIKEAKQVVHNAFDQYLEELKEQVKLMTKDDMQEYLGEASERGYNNYMQALVLCAFAETHDGIDKKAAENTLRILYMKMDIDDLSDMFASML